MGYDESTKELNVVIVINNRYTFTVGKYFYGFLIFISVIFLFVFLVLTLSYGKIKCDTFLGGPRHDQVVGCGFGRSSFMDINRTKDKAFVGYGIVKEFSNKNDKVELKVAIPWGGVFSFFVNVEIDKRPNGKYDICQEMYKRWDIFDCSKILKLTNEETLEKLTELKGKEIIFAYNNIKSNRETENWQKIIENKNTIRYFFLTIRGLLGQNNLYAYMVGY